MLKFGHEELTVRVASVVDYYYDKCFKENVSGKVILQELIQRTNDRDMNEDAAQVLISSGMQFGALRVLPVADVVDQLFVSAACHLDDIRLKRWVAQLMTCEMIERPRGPFGSGLYDQTSVQMLGLLFEDMGSTKRDSFEELSYKQMAHKLAYALCKRFSGDGAVARQALAPLAPFARGFKGLA